MSRRTPEERTEHARRAAQARWARTTEPEDRAAGTAAARAAFKAGFLGMADPHNQLTDDEREQLAEDAWREHFAMLTERSARARRERTEKAKAERMLARARRQMGEIWGTGRR